MDTSSTLKKPVAASSPLHVGLVGWLRCRLASLVVVLVACLLAGEFAWDIRTAQQRFDAYHDRLMRDGVASVAHQIDGRVGDMRRSLQLFADANASILRNLQRNPGDARVFDTLASRLRKYFPDYHGLALTDGEGGMLFDDLGEKVGALCRADLQSVSGNWQDYLTYIHPGPEVYHFDIIVPWGEGQGALLASFKTDFLVELLRRNRHEGYDLLLTRADVPELIEVGTEGARDRLNGRTHLDAGQLAAAAYRESVPGTRWLVNAFPNPSFIQTGRPDPWRDGLVFLLGLLLVSLFMAFLVDRARNRRRLAEERLRKLSMAVEQTDDSVGITDAQGRIEYVNGAFERMTGYDAAEVLGGTFALLKSGHQSDDFYQRLWKTVQQGEPFREVLINRRKNGDIYYEEKTITPLKDERGRITHFVSTGKDISDRMEIQQRLHFLAHHDALTGLPNRALFQDRLQHAMSQAKRNRTLLGVMFIDLDNFKNVNDSLGHAAGDRLLKAVAQRLAECVRSSDTLARLGGDEFAVVLEALRETTDAGHVAQSMLNIFRAPIDLGDHEVVVTASIGITLFPDDAQDPERLCRNADAAMYRSKELGRNTYEYFTADLTARAGERMAMEHQLRLALERSEFQLHFQPKIDLHDGAVTGVEALLRWHNRELGQVPPDRFIPVLESTGLISGVGQWVLQQACAFAARLRAAGHGMSVAVNLSGRQVLEHDLPERIRSMLDEHALPATALELEITETLLIENMAPAVDVLGRLHRAGVSISIDDFGTGYSSLGYLKRLPVDTLKIDRTFVNDLPHDVDDAAITSAIVAMAHSLRLNVVAEGIETPEQARFLRDLGCPQAQGYHYSRPLAGDALLEWLTCRAADATTAPVART